MIITLDPFYPVSIYNEALNNLKTNGVDFTEFIWAKANQRVFCLDLPNSPMLVKFKEITKKDYRYLVTKVLPTGPNDEHVLLRRNTDVDNAVRRTLFTPDFMLKHFLAFVNIPSNELSLELSQQMKLYYLGKYRNLRVHLISNPYNLMLIDPNLVLLKKDTKETPLEFEQRFNYKILRTCFLKKFTRCPYYAYGRYFPNVPSSKEPSYDSITDKANRDGE